MRGTDQRTIACPSHPRLRFSVSNTFIIILSVTPLPAVEAAPGVGEIDADVSGGGLSSGAVAGIVIAGAVFATLLLFLMAPKRHSDEAMNGDEDLSPHVDQNDTEKELMAITNGEVDPDAPARQESPDSSTADMTFCDSGSLSTKESSSKTVAASNYYAVNSLLPVNPDEESLNTNDQQSFFSSEDSVEMQGATTGSKYKSEEVYIAVCIHPDILFMTGVSLTRPI